MNDFTYINPTKIIFGRNTDPQIGTECAAFGKTLILYGGGSAERSGLLGRVRDSLAAAGCEYCELGGVRPNPRLELVYKCIDVIRSEDIKLILAVGGGSVIDTAKAASTGALYDGDVWDFFMKKAVPKAHLPVGTVLTIPAAGSESSPSSVITNEKTNDKRGCTTSMHYPVFSVLNPENTFSLPAYQIACGASDMLAHMMERYFVNTEHCDVTDRLIEGAAQSVIKYAPLTIAEPCNYDFRAEIMWAGTIAHNGSLDTGRGGDWASHQIEHQLSAYYDIAHGAGLAVVFPAWLKFVSRMNPRKPAQFGRRVFGITSSDDNEAARRMIDSLEKFYGSIGMPVRLSEIGINEEKFAVMADKACACKDYRLGSYVRLEPGDVEEIYRLAL
jgi:alcohol dehydrogenase YqhD (iron-dependent ADH family)